MNRLFLILFLAFGLHAKQTVCLNMIVKNEAEVIETCLASVKPLIDYWVIFDTGSTDGTQEKIRAFMKDIPGELHESPWVNFAHNRNEVLQASKGKGDYLLFIDADEVLNFDESFVLPELTKAYYQLSMRQINAADALRTTFVDNRLNWRWEGVLHETLICEDAKTSEVLKGITNVCNEMQGARAKDPMTRIKDAQMLEKALETEPNNSRYVYYLGVSYMAGDEFEKALSAFQRRGRMQSPDFHETFLSIYNCGLCCDKLGSYDDAIEWYFKASNFYPYRVEPLFRIAVDYRKQGKILLGYLLTKYALTLPYPKNDPCVEYTAYDYATLIEFANCALLLGKWQEGLDASLKLLSENKFPSKHRQSILSNIEIAKSKI